MNNLWAETLPYDDYINTRNHEPELTPAGEEQAQRLARFFAGITPPEETGTERRTSISERPVTWPHCVRSKFLRLNRLAND